VKLYDQAEECELKVNDVVEVFGVFELDLEPEGVVPPGADNMQAMVAEERALRPPPSAQPRLHCILHRKLPAQHHPLLPPPDTREEQLVMASARAQLGAVRALLAAGADVEAADGGGWTALQWAAQQGYAEVVAALLAAPGVDAEAADDFGQTPLAVAVAEAAPLLRAVSTLARRAPSSAASI
jgi:hypothetical protein